MIVRALALVVALALLVGCATTAKPYVAGEVERASTALAKSVERSGCLERGFVVYDGGTTHPKSLRVVFSFGNTCGVPTPIDLSGATVHAFGRSNERESDALTLFRKDPYKEIGPRTLDAHAWGTEEIRYQLPADLLRIRRVCVCAHGCASANDALEGGPGVVCFDPAREEVRPAQSIEAGWLEPRWRGESPRTKRCRETGRDPRHYVVGESPCTEFGEFWSVEGQSPINVQVTGGISRVVTFPSVTNDDGARTSGDTLTLGEVAVQIFWVPSPYLYLGGGFGVGFGVGPGGTVIVPRGDSSTSVTAGSLMVMPVVGARLPLGPVAVRAEVTGPLRAVGVIGPTDALDQKRNTLDYGMISVVPRLILEVWTDHRTSLGLMGGADVVHLGGATFGLVYSAHGRAYDGKY